MRVNIYKEELTDRVEIESKPGLPFVGLRFHLELPATVNGVQHKAPFMHRPGDDDSAGVTFWGESRQELIELFQRAIEKLKNSK